MIALSVDTKADAGYLRLRDTSVARTEPFGPSVLVDLDAAGVPVGIEILSLAAVIDVAGFADRYGLTVGARDALEAALPD